MIIDNFVRNAVHHGGVDGVTAIRVVADDASVELRVEDDGPGVPEGIRERLFTSPQVKSGEGMGWGLMLVAHAADRWSAEVYYDPGPPHGFCARFGRRG